MAAFTVHCFNDAYPLYLLMNGVNSFFNSGDWTGYVFMAMSIVTLAGILAVKQIDPIGYLKAYGLPILLFCLFFAQTVTIHLQDEWSEEAYSVDNVPIVIALPLHVTSTIETIFVNLVDEHMTPPTSTSFKEFDFFLEAATLSEVMNGQAFDNFEIQSSIGQYYEDCVLKGIAGGFIDESKFYRSPDLLAELHTPYNIYFTTFYTKDAEPEVMTCSQAYSAISRAIVNETSTGGDISVDSTSNTSPYNYINHLFGNRFQSTVEVSSALDHLAESMFPGYQTTSEALFQQAFIMNGLQSNLAQENPQLLAAISQAEVAQTTGIASASAVYLKKLPRLRAMMKLIIVSLAPIISACFLAQAGRPALQWMVALLWVSLWLPMMGIIKATYIASAIDELQVMILPTGGLTMPNQVRIMSWLADTSTVAGTLAFMIPVLSGIALQMVAPRLAAGIVSSFTAGARVSDGFAQRAGMGALGGAERTARELENDKINQAFMEAGDTQAMRLSQMNQLISNYTGVGVGNIFGSDPTGAGGSHTASMVGTGSSISGGTASAMQNTLSTQVGDSIATSIMASHAAAQNVSTSLTSSETDQLVNSFTSSMSQSEKEDFAKLESAALDHVQKSSYGENLEYSDQVRLAKQISLGLGGDIGGKGILTAGGTGTADSAESAALKRAASDMMSDSATRHTAESLQKSRSQAYAQAKAHLESHGSSTAFAESNSVSDNISKATSAMQQASHTVSVLDAVSQTSTAGTNFSLNLGSAAAYMQRDQLEDMAGLGGMSTLHSALAANPNMDVDDLRRAAYQDLSVMSGAYADGDAAAGANLQNALGEMSTYGNYAMATQAGQAADLIGAEQVMRSELSSGSAGIGVAANNAPDIINGTTIGSGPADTTNHGGPSASFGASFGASPSAQANIDKANAMYQGQVNEHFAGNQSKAQGDSALNPTQSVGEVAAVGLAGYIPNVTLPNGMKSPSEGMESMESMNIYTPES